MGSFLFFYFNSFGAVRQLRADATPILARRLRCVACLSRRKAMDRTEPVATTLPAPPFKSRYQNFIGGRWVEPAAGKYFQNLSPITGKPICEIARSDKDDVERALDAA